MIIACVLALFYRAAIGSQSELKIMTVGKTPPPSQARSVRLRLPAARHILNHTLAAWVCCLLIYFPLFFIIFIRPWSALIFLAAFRLLRLNPNDPQLTHLLNMAQFHQLNGI